MISSRDSRSTQNRLGNDQKSTRNSLLEGGVAGGGVSRGEWAVAESLRHYSNGSAFLRELFLYNSLTTTRNWVTSERLIGSVSHFVLQARKSKVIKIGQNKNRVEPPRFQAIQRNWG